MARFRESKKNKSSTGPKAPGDYSSIMGKIKPVSEFKPEVKVVLYGKPGTGKTTLGGTFPKPALLIDISEKGSDSVRDIKGLDVIRVVDWDELELLYWMLRENPKGYKSVIVDTMSYAQTLAIKKVLEEKGKAVEEGKIGGWGVMAKKDWGEVSARLNPFITNMRDLPLNLVFIAHDRVFNAGEEEDEATDDRIEPSVGPRLMPSVASTLNAAVGMIGNTFIRERFVKVEVKGKKREKRMIEYCLRVGPHSYYITKVRSPKSVVTPDLIADPSYEDILELIMGEPKE